MTANLQQVIIASSCEKPNTATGTATSPLRKDASNPQQGMADPTASVSANTAATVSNTACTSPLTITSLEAAAGVNAVRSNDGVPQVVVPLAQRQQQPEPSVVVPTVEAMLTAPMAELGLNSRPPAVFAPSSHMEEKKMRTRTAPTEHDNRKLFVGGLPTDVVDCGFLEFFQQFGEVIDSVVMVDRISKRSRGFGFVTFASEIDATSLLTAIPGKTGYVVINGKQCEVKASTPKADDGSGKPSHHGAPGMWRSNPPRHDHRGYTPRHPNNGHHSGPMKMHHHHQPRGEKYFNRDDEFNGEVDGRNFDEVQVYAQQPHTSYQPMNVYGHNVPASNQYMYHQNYQNIPAAPNSYVYPNSSAASIPSSWDASYPAAPNQGYGQYPVSGNPEYYDPYSQQYSNQYGNNSMPMVAGQAGYANYSGYYSEEGAPVSPMAANDDSGFAPYPQSFPDNGDYDQAPASGQYK